MHIIHELTYLYPGFQRIFFLLGALRLVNAASPRTISVHKKKISSGTQGNLSQAGQFQLKVKFLLPREWFGRRSILTNKQCT